MTFEQIDARNTSDGMYTVLQYVADIEPLFFPLVLFAIFIIASMGSFFTQKELLGKGDMKSSLAVAGYMTTIVAYVMHLIPGVVNVLTVVTCFVVSILMTLFLLIPERRE